MLCTYFVRPCDYLDESDGIYLPPDLPDLDACIQSSAYLRQIQNASHICSEVGEERDPPMTSSCVRSNPAAQSRRLGTPVNR
jgi:hypothetical protein